MEEQISDFANAVRIFEKQFRCRLCCHDYSGQLQNVPLPHYHLNVFCTRLKERKEKLTDLCIDFDRNQVQRHLMEQGTRPFFKCCHCGMLEAVFPVAEAEKLYGVLFAGPFQARRITGALVNPGSYFLQAEHLPELKREEEDPLFAYGALLAANLALRMRKQPQIPHSRKEVIEAFLELNCTRDIGLSELADTLSLTPARASEAVKKLFGRNFSVLLRERRLEKAKLLLRNSAFTIDSIASRCGFRDGTYFHRVFRKETGATPVRYRSENRVEEA